MLRQGSDVLAAYENTEQQRKMRQAYCAHVLDHVIRERHQVHLNNEAIKTEEAAQDGESQQLTVGNVFAVAKQMNSSDDDRSSSSSSSEEEEVGGKAAMEGEKLEASRV